MAIEKPFLVLPLALSNITTGNAKTNRPATHLGLPQYSGMRWESNGNTNLWVRGQFGGATKAVEFMSLMAANALPGTTIRLRLGTTQAEVDGGAAPYDSGAQTLILPARTRDDGLYHSHLELPSTVNASWWRIDIGGHTGDFSASALIMGSKRTPARFYNRDREIGFKPLGSVDFSRNGVIARTPGVMQRVLLFRLQWVEEAEFWDTWTPLMTLDAQGYPPAVFWAFDPEPTVYRQAKTFLGYMTRPLLMRGNTFPKANEVDFELTAIL